MFGGSETECRGERKSKEVIKNSEAHYISGPQLVRGSAHAGGLAGDSVMVLWVLSSLLRCPVAGPQQAQ